MHGDAYIVGDRQLYRHLTRRISSATGCRVFVPDYRLAPEHPFPAALHDALATYLWLIDPTSPMFGKTDAPLHDPIPPSDIVIMGDSAGGGLTMSLLHYINLYLRNARGGFLVPMPAAAVLMSPWVDLSCSAESWHSNGRFDWLPPKVADLHGMLGPSMRHPAYLYCLGNDPTRPLVAQAHSPAELSGVPLEPPPPRRKASDMAARQRHERTARGALADSPDFLLRDTMDRFVRHPLVSPLFADDFVGLPPILVQAGECEFLRDESIALAFKIEQQNAGSTSSWVRHELYTDMVHVFQAVAWIPAAQLALRRIAHFIDHVDGRAPASPPLLTPEEAPLIHTIDSHCQL